MSENAIDEIEKLRAENNKKWMNIVRIAMEYAPEKTRKILAQINECDKKISEQVSKI